MQGNIVPELKASVQNPAVVFGDHTCILRMVSTPFSISENVIPLIGKNLPTSWIYYAIKGKQRFEEYRKHWMKLVIKPVLIPALEVAIMFDRYHIVTRCILLNTSNCERTLALTRMNHCNYLLSKT